MKEWHFLLLLVVEFDALLVTFLLNTYLVALVLSAPSLAKTILLHRDPYAEVYFSCGLLL